MLLLRNLSFWGVLDTFKRIFLASRLLDTRELLFWRHKEIKEGFMKQTFQGFLEFMSKLVSLTFLQTFFSVVRFFEVF